MPRPLLLMMPNGGEDGVILLWYATKNRPKWVECRGAPYSQWALREDTPMYHLHSALEGWHATVLHQEEVLMLHDRHPEYTAIARFMEET